MFDFEYIGNIHIHSLYSDGEGSISEIAGFANNLGLNFICLNDHDFMTGDLHQEEQGFYGKVLVLTGLEIGERYHHYLAYNLKEMIKGNGLAPQEVIDKVKDQGGLGFLAHPFEKGMPFHERSIAYTWNDISVNGFTGVCIWNFTSRWKERIRSPFHGLFFLKFKTQFLKPPSSETMAFYDLLCLKRPVVAIGSSDAHGTRFRWGPFQLRPFTYDFLLNSINIHILLNKRMSRDVEEAKGDIYEAMRSGRLFIAHDNLRPARGFRFDFVSGDGSNLFMGEEGGFHEGDLVVELPDEGEIRLIRNGRLEKRWYGTEAVYHVIEKGVYRVEVYHRLFLAGWRPWIFSNPIYLR